MKINKLFAGLVALIAGTAVLFAQTGTMSPYSGYGYGLLNDNASATQRSMGGIGYAMNSGRQINVMNPASYARIDSLTFLFDMGIDLSNMWITEKNSNGNLSETNSSGGLDYVTLQFPLSKRIGMSAGILPYSTVGYGFANEIENGYTSRSGSGSINKAYLGMGCKLFAGLSIGINVSYLFGNVIYDTYAVTDGGSTSLYERKLQVRDYQLEGGLQYTLGFGYNRLTLGAVYTDGKKVLGRMYTYAHDVDADSKMFEVGNEKLDDKYELPSTYGFGLNYQWRNNLMIEADFTYQPWAEVKYNGLTNQFDDRYKIAAGAQYQPAARGSYLRRVQYRAGVFYDRDYIMVRDNNVREYGATIGLGLPIPNFKTVVNLGVGWLHRQTYPTAMITEDYINITIGVNFNEMWFRKSKIY